MTETATSERTAAKATVFIVADRRAVVDQVETILAADESLELFVGSGSVGLLRLNRGATKPRPGLQRPAGAPIVEPAPEPWLQERISTCATFVRATKDGDRVTDAPGYVAKTLLARGAWKFRPLEAVIDAPTMRPDGSILDFPGYDEETALLYEPARVFAAIADAPTFDDVQTAVERLVAVLRDFPFVAACDRAAAVAMILTAVGRFAIDGPAPLFAVRATAPGTGKSMLCDVASTIATGRPAARMVAGTSDDEMRKLILAVGIERLLFALWDNVEGMLGSAALAAALTGTTFADRLLGESRRVTVSLRCTTWAATGNNLSFRGDLGRRVEPIDLDAGVEHPEDRHDFAVKDLLGYVREQRAQLVADALTILRGFHVAGRPGHGKPRVGSFEAWDDLIRAACIWAGLEDPVAGRQRVREEGDADLDALRSALEEWSDAFGTEPVSLSSAMERAAHSSDLRGALAALAGKSGDKLDAKALGYALRRVRGRLVDGRRFENLPKSHGKVRWRIAAPGADGADGADLFQSATNRDSELHARGELK